MTPASLPFVSQQDELFENFRSRWELETLSPWADFARLKSRRDLKKFRIHEWNHYASFVKQFREGESPHFGGEKIESFAKTSASSGAPKYVPLTESYLVGHRIFVLNMFMGFADHGELQYERLLDAKRVCFPNRACYESIGGVPVGSISGLLYLDGLDFGTRTFIPDSETVALASWADKLPAIADQARDQDVRILSCLPDMGIHFLRFALSRYGVSHLRDLWPNLELITVAGERLTARHRLAFRELLCRNSQDTLRFCSIYSATEAHLAHSRQLDSDELQFPMDLNLLLFLREEDAELESPELLLPEELTPGQTYFPIVTTPGGLVHYPLWDRLRITHLNPFCAEIVGRRGEDISVFGEKISQDAFRAVIEQLEKSKKLSVEQWAVFPEKRGEEPWRLVWVFAAASLSPKAAPSGERPDLGAACDALLDQLNSGYADFRRGGFYGDSRVEVIPLETFVSRLETQMDRVSQFKFRRLFASREAYLASLSPA